MTKEEAHKILCRNILPCLIGEWREAISIATKALEAEPHWIPVTEKLPGIGEPVLDESLSVNWMSYKSGGKEWVFPRDVKAWIPLPGEPYKEVTE